MTLLTHHEAYLAMFSYLEELYLRTSSDDIGAILGQLALLPDGKSADPAAMIDFERAIARVKTGQINGFMELS